MIYQHLSKTAYHKKYHAICLALVLCAMALFAPHKADTAALMFPDLLVTIAGPTHVSAGTEVDFFITVANIGAGATSLDDDGADEWHLQYHLPSVDAATYVSSSNGSFSGSHILWGNNGLESSDTDNVDVLEPGASQTFSVTLIIHDDVTHLFSSGWCGEFCGLGIVGNALQTEVVPEEELQGVTITKTAAEAVVAGSYIAYEITVSNFSGEDVTIHHMWDGLPDNVTHVNGGSLNGSLVTWGAPTLNEDFTSFTVAQLAHGESHTEELIVLPNDGEASVTNDNYGVVYTHLSETCCVWSFEPVVTTIVDGSTTLALSMEGPTQLTAGSIADFTFNVTNIGTAPTSISALGHDEWGVTYSLGSGVEWVDGGTYIPADNTVVFTDNELGADDDYVDQLAPGESQSLTLRLKVNTTTVHQPQLIWCADSTCLYDTTSMTTQVSLGGGGIYNENVWIAFLQTKEDVLKAEKAVTYTDCLSQLQRWVQKYEAQALSCHNIKSGVKSKTYKHSGRYWNAQLLEMDDESGRTTSHHMTKSRSAESCLKTLVALPETHPDTRRTTPVTVMCNRTVR